MQLLRLLAQLHWKLSYFIIKALIKIDRIGLVNIVAEKYIVKEFLQFDAKPKIIVDEIKLILNNETYRTNMVKELSLVSSKLGKTGGINNMADLILEMLD